jgi:hypothetical protein
VPVLAVDFVSGEMFCWSGFHGGRQMFEMKSYFLQEQREEVDKGME